MSCKGDKSKQPPECESIFVPDEEGSRTGHWTQCPNLKEEKTEFPYSMQGEHWGCDVCGKSFYLDYDEMR